MILRCVKLATLAVAVVALGAIPAEAAKKQKSKRLMAARAATQAAPHYNQSLFMKGPLYFGNTYLGDDPDPFIRAMIARDNGKFGGSE